MMRHNRSRPVKKEWKFAPFFRHFLVLIVGFPTALYAYDDQSIIEQCDEKWGTDFSMVQYCRDKQRKAGKAYDRFKQQVRDNDTAAAVLSHCENRWQKDYSMVTYCIEKQVNAIEALTNPAKDIPTDVQNTITQECASRWGTDFAMIEYCVEKQSNAWRELQ